MNSALLVMDVQQGVVERHGASDGLLGRLGQAVTAARNARLPVVFARVAFRPGFPEVSPANRSFSAIAETAGDHFGENSAEVFSGHASPHGLVGIQGLLRAAFASPGSGMALSRIVAVSGQPGPGRRDDLAGGRAVVGGAGPPQQPHHPVGHDRVGAELPGVFRRPPWPLAAR